MSLLYVPILTLKKAEYKLKVTVENNKYKNFKHQSFY